MGHPMATRAQVVAEDQAEHGAAGAQAEHGAQAVAVAETQAEPGALVVAVAQNVAEEQAGHGAAEAQDVDAEAGVSLLKTYRIKSLLSRSKSTIYATISRKGTQAPLLLLVLRTRTTSLLPRTRITSLLPRTTSLFLQTSAPMIVSKLNGQYSLI